MPSDNDIFKLREKEKLMKQEVSVSTFNKIYRTRYIIKNVFLLKERERNKTLKVHQKLTTNTKLVEGMKAGLKPNISDDENEDDDVHCPF